LVVAAAWAITAVLGLVIVGKVTGSGPMSTGSARHTGGLPGLGWNANRYPLGPPGLAEKTTAAGAQAAAGFSVPVPSDAAASQANLTQAWVNKYNGEVALVFDKGKVDITMARATQQKDLRYFQAFVAQRNKNRVTDAIEQVNGRPALVITPNTSVVCHCNPAVVEFDRNGIDVSIYSNTYGTGTLLAIADSMR